MAPSQRRRCTSAAHAASSSAHIARRRHAAVLGGRAFNRGHAHVPHAGVRGGSEGAPRRAVQRRAQVAWHAHPDDARPAGPAQQRVQGGQRRRRRRRVQTRGARRQRRRAPRCTPPLCPHLPRPRLRSRRPRSRRLRGVRIHRGVLDPRAGLCRAARRLAERSERRLEGCTKPRWRGTTTAARPS